MKLLVPALLLSLLAARAAAQAVPGTFEALYSQALKDSGKLFEGKDKSLSSKAPGVVAVLGAQLPKEGDAAAEAKKKLMTLEKTLDDAVGIQQGADAGKLSEAEYEKKVRKTAQALGVDGDKAWALYRPDGVPGGPGSAGSSDGRGGEAGGQGGGKKAIMHGKVASVSGGPAGKEVGHAKAIASALGTGYAPQTLAASDATSVYHSPYASYQPNDPKAPGYQLPEGLSTHSKEPPSTKPSEKPKEEPGTLERYKQWVEKKADEYKDAAGERRKQGAEKLAKAMDPNLSWWDKAKLRASAGVDAVAEYGDNLAAGDKKTWRNTGLVVAGVAVAVVAAPVVAGMAAGTTAVTAATVGGAALHTGLAGLTAYAIVDSGNELVREPNLKNAAFFALAAAPVGKLEKITHAVVSSRAADAVLAYAGKAMPVIRSAGEGLASLPGITKAVEAVGSVGKVLKGSEAAVKVAEVSGEIVSENAGHLAHAGVHMGAEAVVPAHAAQHSAHAGMAMDTTETVH